MNEKTVNSILKNVPLEFKDLISSLAPSNGKHKLRWKARQPVEDCPQNIRDSYNGSGSLPFKFAQSADLYVDFNGSQNDLFEKAMYKERELKEGYKADCLRLEDRITQLSRRVSELVNLSNENHKEGIEKHYNNAVSMETVKQCHALDLAKRDEVIKDYKNALKSLTTFISKNL